MTKKTKASKKPKGTIYENKLGQFSLIKGKLFDETGEACSSIEITKQGGALKKLKD